MSEPIEPASAAEAARELARVLLEQADALDLHDLRATGAIENVRVQARALADAVHERGWGDIFLGIDSYDPDELDDLPLGPDDFDDPDGLPRDGRGRQLDDLDELEEPLLPENGVRLSYQARYDFVVTDPEAFVQYVRSRADEAQNDEVIDDIEDAQSAFELLCYLDGLGSKDYDNARPHPGRRRGVPQDRRVLPLGPGPHPPRRHLPVQTVTVSARRRPGVEVDASGCSGRCGTGRGGWCDSR